MVETLEKLAIKYAIQDRTWLKADMLFKKLTNEMRQRFLQTCLETTNTAAFEEFLLCLRQPKLTITNNPFFTGEFALVVASCIQSSSKWAETTIAEIDFGGCEIGPLATAKFCDIILEQNHTKKKRAFKWPFESQAWSSERPRLLKICINLHVKRETHANVCEALRANSSSLQPYAIKAEALGRRLVCELLDVLAEKNLPLRELDVFMNSLGKEGVADICNRLMVFQDLRNLNLAYAMVSNDDREAAMLLGEFLRNTTSFKSLTLSSNIWENCFSVIFPCIPCSIRELDLSCCILSTDMVTLLANRLIHTEIETLDISYNPFKRNEQFQNLLLLIGNCMKTLRKLNISNTGLTYKNATRLAEFFRRNRSKINLECLQIENEAIKNDELLKNEIKMALPETNITW